MGTSSRLMNKMLYSVSVVSTQDDEMPHYHRFYVPPECFSGGDIALPPEEAHHALHVVRIKPGDEIILFDGAGREVKGMVAETTKREVIVALRHERLSPKPTIRLTLLQAWLLRERCVEYVIQHGTEIGIARFCFFKARHSEKMPKTDEKTLDKWRRIAIETCKQCGRLWLPEFVTATSFADALEDVSGRLLIATQDTAPTSLRKAVTEQTELTLAIGPEGDFAAEEVALACDRGAIPIGLGDATYRSEVAATLAAALVLYECGQLGP